jgi:hypothetical protein
MVRLERQRRGKVIEAAPTSDEVTGRFELRQRAGRGDRSEQGDRAPPVSDLDGLARFDASKQLARSLPQLPYPHACHVLFVAHPTLIRIEPNPIRRLRRAKVVNAHAPLNLTTLAPGTVSLPTENDILQRQMSD